MKFRLAFLVSFFVEVLVANSTFAQDKQFVDSLISELPNQKGLKKVILLTDISFYSGFYDIVFSETQAKEAEKLARSLNNDTALSETHNNLAIVYFRKGEMEKSLAQNHAALKIRRKIRDQRGIAASMSKIGNIYTEQSLYDSALYYQQECLKVFEEINDERAIGQTLSNLCNLHKKLGNYPLMKKYALESIAQYKGMDFKYGLGTGYGNLAVYYDKTNQLDSSIIYSIKAMQLFEEVGALIDLSTCENNIGLYYRKKGKDAEGLSYYIKAYEHAKAIGDLYGLASYAANAAGACFDLNKQQEALNYFLEAKNIAEQNHLNSIRTQVYEGLSKLYAATGNYKLAYQEMMAYRQLYDSLFNEEKAKIISDAESKYRTERKERELLEQKSINATIEKEKTEAQLKVSNRNKWIYGISGLSLSILFFILFLAQRRTKKLQQEKAEAILKEREKGIESVFFATEEERKRIARELHDGIGQQLGGLKMAWQQVSQSLPVNEEQKTKLQSLTSILDDTANEVRELSHQMMPKVLSEMGLIPALQDMLKKTFSLSSVKYNFETFNIDQRLNESLEISLYRITQELVSNSLKHGQASHISIQLFINNKTLLLIVEDNGKGFEKTESKSGIGLMNIATRLSTVKGEFNFEPSPESGTVATIRIPVTEGFFVDTK